jgi:thiol-disulfide isomerase/thioredoxin
MKLQAMTVWWRALLLLVVCAGAAGAAADPPAAAVQVLPDVMLRGLNGPSMNLARLRGRPLLINVWASWCEPCRAEMASLERLAWRGVPSGYAIIGISTDDDPAQARALLANTHATISHYIDVHLQMETLLGASRLPLTVLVDANGRVLRRIYGARQWDSADSLRLLAEAARRSP